MDLFDLIPQLEQMQAEPDPEELAKELAAAIKTRNATRQLLKTEGYTFFLKLLETQTKLRTGKISQEDCKNRDFLAGEISGIMTAMQILETLDSTAQETIQYIQSLQEQQQEEKTNASD